jgi:hypothetical protein
MTLLNLLQLRLGMLDRARSDDPHEQSRPQ